MPSDSRNLVEPDGDQEDVTIERSGPGPAPTPGGVAPAHPGAPELTALAPERPAHYARQDEIARGGQGVVLRVWDNELGRELAMKVVEQGSSPNEDSTALGRFLDEARITGRLDHPGIVPVHELGVSHDGHAFFTMKLVRGRELSKIFDLARDEQEGWSLPRTLNVMLRVCEAMAYAHHKGIVHRDLKPANVMVGSFGAVYVMDWGIARVLDQSDEKDTSAHPSGDDADGLRREIEANESSLYTMDGDVLGTPAYMSPEQARGELRNVGPATDVYAVGAMLYHLLSGRMPYEPAVGARRNAVEVLELAREVPPTSVRELAPDMPAELIAICEKAMARELDQRYASMEAVADDLRAYLEGRVVSAHEAGSLAELRKWIGRNKPLASAMATAVLALVVGVATSSTLYLEARASEGSMRFQRDRADNNAERYRAQVAVAEAEAERAQREERTTERVLELLTGMFAEQQPSQARGATLTIKEVLDRSAKDIASELEDEPEARARVTSAMARLYFSLGLYSEAEPLFKQSLAAWREAVGDEHVGTLLARYAVASVYRQQGRFAEAEQLLVEVLDDAKAQLGPNDVRTLTILSTLATVSSDQGRFEKGEALAQVVLDGLRAIYGNEHAESLEALSGLALAKTERGRVAEARDIYEELLDLRRRLLGEDHPDTQLTRNSLAHNYAGTGRREEAVDLYRTALRHQRAVLGSRHPSTLSTMNNLGIVLMELGQTEEADRLFVAAHEGRFAELGAQHPDTLLSLSTLANLRRVEGRYEEAEQLFLDVIGRLRAIRGDRHPNTLASINNLAVMYIDQDRFAEGEAVGTEALEGRRAVLGPDHPSTLRSQRNLLRCLDYWLNDLRAERGNEDPETIAVQARLGRLQLGGGNVVAAEPLLMGVLIWRTERLGEEDPLSLAALEDVTRAWFDLGRLDDALAESYRLLDLTPPDAPERIAREQLCEQVRVAHEAR